MTQLPLPSAVAAERVRQVRDRQRDSDGQRLSAAKLADRCAAHGMPQLNRHVIANIESGRRESISVDELFVLARALGVAPVHLLVPVDDDAHMATTPSETAVARHVRRWVTGDQPWAGSDAETYWSEAPPGWRDRLAEGRRRIEQFLATQLGRAIERVGDADGRVAVDDLLRELWPMIGRVPNGNGGDR